MCYRQYAKLIKQRKKRIVTTHLNVKLYRSYTMNGKHFETFFRFVPSKKVVHTLTHYISWDLFLFFP